VTTARIAGGDLAGLDALDVDALALPLFAVRAQPQDVAGFADWRLAGRIARLIASGRFSGARDEALLMPGQGRCGAQRVFLLGLGAPQSPAKLSFDQAVQVLAQAGARKLAFGAPSMASPKDAGPVAERFIEALGANQAAFDELVLLDAHGHLKEAEASLRRSAKDAGLSWSPA